VNVEADPNLDEQFTARLLACDEALAAGQAPTPQDDGEPPELRARLERGIACVQLLQRLRPQRDTSRGDDCTATVSSTGRAASELADGAATFPSRLGRFVIRRALGSGGFGVVYLAYDPVLCRDVALKIPRADALVDADCRARFQREARAAAVLDHPHLVPVHEAGLLGSLCYIALAYCPGDNLAEWLKQRAVPVPCVQAAQLVALLAQAVHYAHARGILHRDLKPSNILLSPVVSTDPPTTEVAETTHAARENHWRPEPGTALLPRITDFGMAKIAVGDPGQTRTGAILGTPSYMAPEQVERQNRQVGPTTDVYALGAILYEVLTGLPPFWTETTVETLLLVKSAEPVAPGRLRPRLPRDLETICLKCLQKEQHKRYPSAEALADDLRRFIEGRPILARRTGTAEQLLKWARRRPALAASISALAVVSALGIGGILQQWKATQDALANEYKALGRARTALKAEVKERLKGETALYHHRVALAYHEWSSGSVARAAQLLDECAEKLRDWEWAYVHRLCHPPALTLRVGTPAALAVAFSPDGRRLASGGGRWGSSEPGEVTLWDAESGRALWTAPGREGPAMSVAFSPDGRQLASASVQHNAHHGAITIWDTDTGKEIHPRLDPSGGAMSLAYSPDGQRLAAASIDCRVRLFDPRTGAIDTVLSGPQATIFSVAFSPDGRRLASAGWDGTARVWDVNGGKLAYPPLVGPTDLRCVTFSPDGQRVATASFDQSVKLWDAATGQHVRTYWHHNTAVKSLAFAPDSRYLASGDQAGTMRIWNLQADRAERTIRGHTGSVDGLAYSPDGRRLASASGDGTMRVWDVTQTQDAYPLAGQTSGARSPVFSSDGRWLAVTGWAHSSGLSKENRVRVWSMADPSAPRIWAGHTDWVSCVTFTPDGKLLASGSKDKTVRLWDVGAGKTLRELKGHDDLVTGVSFRADGARLASSSLDGTVKLWDVATGQLMAPVLTHARPVRDVVFAPEGDRLVSVGDNGMIRVWESATGTEIGALSSAGQIVERVCFSRDGRRLATAGADGIVHVWDVATEPSAGAGIVPLQDFSGHKDTVVGLSFSHDGRRLASASRDRTVRIWDIASGTEALALHGHRDGVTGVAFSPDDRRLVSTSVDAIKVWEALDDPAAAPSRQILTPTEAVAWHHHEIEACVQAKPVPRFGVAFHVGRWLAADPNDYRPYIYRADMEESLGHWHQAADDYAQAIAHGGTNSWMWLHLAGLHLQQGDTDAYRQCCAAMLARFERSPNAIDANETAWACALGPRAVTDLDAVIRLAEKAVAAHPKQPGSHNTLGAILYRAGRFSSARAALYDALRLQRGSATPEDALFLALTEQRLDHDAAARFWLDKALALLESMNGGPPPEGHDRISAQGQRTQLLILCREAESLLLDPL
jgi:eukaryotic-like serine/threonine-protein kinase